MGRKKAYSPETIHALRVQHQQALTRDLTSYASLIGETFAARLNMLARVIGDVHHVSLGTYKERLLASTIRDHLPKSFSVGTGFILFPTERQPDRKPPGYDELNQSDYEISKQCDILIYDSARFPAVFQDGDFVVLRPEAVHTVIEVKGALDNEEIDSIVGHFIDLGTKWQKCREFYRVRHQPPLQQPSFCAMAWRVDIDGEGRPKTDGTRLRERIANLYRERVTRNDLLGLPVISQAHIYNNSSVALTSWSASEEPEIFVGWYTMPGQFTRFDGENNPRFEGDRTIASLLAEIHASLDSGLNDSFNRFFSYLDETRAAQLQFVHSGFSQWLSNEDVKTLYSWQRRSRT